MKTFFSLLLTLSVGSISAQTTLKKDPRVDELIKLQQESKGPNGQTQMDGFRLQLTFNSDKKSIDEARNTFYSIYSKVDTYVEFKAPNFFLKVGDFRTQLEAEKIKQELMVKFPEAFVVKEKINLPRLD